MPALLLLWCLMVAVTQQVNCFPDDGWFHTQYKLIGRWPGEDNYSPIAAPAVLFAANHVIAARSGLSLEGELYTACVMHALLLFGSLVLIAGALRASSVSAFITAATTAATAAYLGSTLVTQSFWSENSMIFLMAATCRLGVALWEPAASARTAALIRRAALLGTVLALATVTRVIPVILVVPFALLLYWCHGRRKALLGTVVLVAPIILLALLAMAANQYRFGRFELSNSTGRHLWQSLYPIADVMLRDDPAYPALSAAYPDLTTRAWWDVSPESLPAYAHLSREAFLRQLSVDAIRRHPGPWLRHGAAKLTTLILQPFPRIGLWYRVTSDTNLLGRSELLPPLLGAAEAPVRRLLDGLHHGFGVLHPAIVIAPLLLLITGLAAAGWRSSIGGMPRGSSTLRCLTFFSFAFVGCIYTSLQVEVLLARYTLPYAPFLAMMAGAAAQRACGREWR